MTAARPSSTASRSATVPTAAGTFSPLRTALGLDSHGYSPALLRTIVELAGRLRSSARAALAQRLCHHLDVSDRHVARLTATIGAELAAQRDRQVEQRRRRELQPEVSAPPAVAVVEVDGGRLGTRQVGAGPGVHQPQQPKGRCPHNGPCGHVAV